MLLSDWARFPARQNRKIDFQLTACFVIDIDPFIKLYWWRAEINFIDCFGLLTSFYCWFRNLVVQSFRPCKSFPFLKLFSDKKKISFYFLINFYLHQLKLITVVKKKFLNCKTYTKNVWPIFSNKIRSSEAVHYAHVWAFFPFPNVLSFVRCLSVLFVTSISELPLWDFLVKQKTSSDFSIISVQLKL